MSERAKESSVELSNDEVVHKAVDAIIDHDFAKAEELFKQHPGTEGLVFDVSHKLTHGTYREGDITGVLLLAMFIEHLLKEKK
jgi:hypothetical protein